MASSRWTDALLDEAGRQGDDPTVRPNADDLAAAAMSSAEGIRRQNELLQLVDLLMDSTALALTEKSVLRQKLGEYPPETLRYFEPAPAPEWLDEAKLRAASRLWHDNSLACVGALYSLSLPACYLCEEGVPALYATAKLQSRQYIYQRVYETLLFADDVLDEKRVPGARGLHPRALPRRSQGHRPRGRLDRRARGEARAHGRRGCARPRRLAWSRRRRSAARGSCGGAASWPPGRCASCTRRSASCSRTPTSCPTGRPKRTARADEDARAGQSARLPAAALEPPSRAGRAVPGQPPDQPGAAGDGAPHLRLHDPARPRALGLPALAAGQGRLPPPLEGGRARHGHPRGPHDRRLGRGEGAARHRPRPPGLSLRRRQAHDDDTHGRRPRLPPPPAGGTAPASPRPPDHRPAPPDGPPLPRDDPGARGLRGLAEAAAPPRLRGDHPRPAPVLPDPAPGRGAPSP